MASINPLFPAADTASWDYLVLTASNTSQARAYELQLKQRQDLGLLSRVRECLVVPDPRDRRVGSGGSTQHCLQEILNLELRKGEFCDGRDPGPANIFEKLHILIVHAGGDSRRLPPYGPCGKIFMPLPGETDSALPLTLFDRLLPVYLGLPRPAAGRGRLVVTTGDVLLRFDPAVAWFSGEGITGLGCRVSPQTAKNHGVFCPGAEGRIRRFLQKPSPEEQARSGALDDGGRAVLDIGVLNFDASSADHLLNLVSRPDRNRGEYHWKGPLAEEILDAGLDLFREILCALGTEISYPAYREAVRKSGSNLSDEALLKIFDVFNATPAFSHVMEPCGFLHFGTLEELVTSGLVLFDDPEGTQEHEADSRLEVNNRLDKEGRISGPSSWVEGCRIESHLDLSGDNVVVGVPVNAPLTLPEGACLDVLPGRGRTGGPAWFIRCYGRDDTFKAADLEEAVFCGHPVHGWIEAVGAGDGDVWPESLPQGRRSLWTARLFPTVREPEDFRSWLWMYNPGEASPAEKKSWLEAERLSLADHAERVDLEIFLEIRRRNRAACLIEKWPRLFDLKSEFSAGDLALLLREAGEPARAAWLAEVLTEACRRLSDGGEAGLERILPSRLLHCLGTALRTAAENRSGVMDSDLTELFGRLSAPVSDWLVRVDPKLESDRTPEALAAAVQNEAFRNLSATIVLDSERRLPPPENALRSDEIIWGRAPARLDLGGGWTDTPPYALEYGGRVINAAVDLNGQPPIQVYARVLQEPEIRINSIDHSRRIVIKTLDELLDYRSATSEFGLAKAALALTGFSPKTAGWPTAVGSLKQMLDFFGGGIELTTLAAIPSGSGLGTSSIMGAVIFSVLHHLIGREISDRELFHQVLKLEQELTTGGGWQDQIGGTCPGVKVITAQPGLIPDPDIHPVGADLLDPRTNGGRTLLYYTGLRRLAKNILRHVVGNYLDRNRLSMTTLRALHEAPPRVAEAMNAGDLEAFGRWIDRGWKLNKAIDPDSTTPEIEDILVRVRPYIFGAKLLGAGGGGFLLLICRSPEAAENCRRDLETDPPNSRARFFEYAISGEGLVVTIC